MSWDKIKILSLLTIIALVPVGANASLTFGNLRYSAISIKPEASTGLNEIYVLYDTEGATAIYNAQSSSVSWQKFDSYGGGFATDITPERDGDTYTVALNSEDTGFIISDGDKRYYYWIVDYARHMASLDDIAFANEQECDRARLTLIGNAAKIDYYTINGQPKQLSRELKLSYQSLKYDSESEQYVIDNINTEIASIDGTFGVAAPLCDTQFTLAGDQFLKKWGIEQSVTSDTYHAIGVEAHTNATQEMRENDNEQKDDGDMLGGSAPAHISFTAAVTDAAIFREWQISRDPEMEAVDDRFQSLDLDYTFTENGTFYVRFIANNAEGSCEYFGDTYTVSIGESQLLCPNAFSPDASPGVNDEWKVSYKSIISFECHIFNRWGQQMASFTDPSQGWDGKYKGKYVPAGVYYYVIKAKGADGKRYNLNGDINIIKSKKNPLSSSSTETTE